MGYNKFYGRAATAGLALLGSRLGSYRGGTSRGLKVKGLGTYMGGGSRTYTANRSGSDNAPVTNQFDVRTWYKKKRMPTRKRKNWKKFSTKVKAVFNKEIAPTYFLYRTTTTISSSANTQGWGSLMLYTANMGTNPNNDLGRIASGVQGGTGNQLGTKYRFESACLDVLFRNKSSSTALVDIYTIYCRKDVPDNYESPYAVLTQLDATADQDTAGDTKIADNSIGFTPFHCPLFCSFFKVAKKRTLTLGAGAVSEIQMRDAKNRKLWGIDYTGKSAMRGWTKGYLVCVRGAYDSSVETPVTPAIELDTAYTRSYTLREISDKTWKSALV